jgi:putative membrane protein
MNARTLRIGVAAAGLAGIALLVGIIVSSHVATLGELLLTVGWGIAIVTAAHLLPLAACTLAWRSAANQVWRGSRIVFFWARLVRESVSALLPVAHVGGDVVGARVLTFHGAAATQASASVLVDLTLEFLTQIAFTMIGLGLLLSFGGGAALGWSLLGLAAAAAAGVGFVWVQRLGIFRLCERALQRMAERFDLPALGSLANLHDTIFAIYRQRRAIALSTCWHLLAWLLGAFEVWLTLKFLDANAGLVAALTIESLGLAIRSAAFVIPGGLGIQEGGFVLLGTLFGLSPETGLAISLVKRIREVGLGVPAILAWQVIEGRRLFAAPTVRVGPDERVVASASPSGPHSSSVSNGR